MRLFYERLNEELEQTAYSRGSVVIFGLVRAVEVEDEVRHTRIGVAFWWGVAGLEWRKPCA